MREISFRNSEWSVDARSQGTNTIQQTSLTSFKEETDLIANSPRRIFKLPLDTASPAAGRIALRWPGRFARKRGLAQGRWPPSVAAGATELRPTPHRARGPRPKTTPR